MKEDEKALRQVGERIREIRSLQQVSQEEFAARCGLDRTYISGIERGIRNVSFKNLYSIATNLGVPLHRLFGGIETNCTVDPDEQEVYLVNQAFTINPGFEVNATHVTSAALSTATELENFPFSLFRNIDLKSLSGIVGALFATCLAENAGAIVNPIEKGHPDIIPLGGKTATEEQLRNYPQGLEIKCTVGNVLKGSDLGSGDERIENLTGITWQAHHREVRSLMGLIIDFSGSDAGRGRYPMITGVFYTDRLVQDDWGQISGTTGRNTKVTGMLVSGKQKIGSGWIILENNPHKLTKYQQVLSFNIGPKP